MLNQKESMNNDADADNSNSISLSECMELIM